MQDGSRARPVERNSLIDTSLAAFAGREMLAPANRNLSAKLTVLIAVPTLEAGAADTNALDLVKLLHGAGHRPVVVSSGGKLTGAVTANGGEFIAMNVASKNPIVMMQCARQLSKLIAQRRCDIVHALGALPRGVLMLPPASTASRSSPHGTRAFASRMRLSVSITA